MEEAEEVSLEWHGPITPGSYIDVDDADILQEPAVYLCIMDYRAKVAVYAGMTKNFLHRLRDHVVATLGLTYSLRDEDGAIRYEPRPVHGYLADLHDVEANQEMAAAEVRRMTWYYAPAEPQGLRYIEGLLIRCLKSLAEQGTEIGGKQMICDNPQSGTSPIGPVRVHSRGAEMPMMIFGSTLTWPLEARV